MPEFHSHRSSLFSDDLSQTAAFYEGSGFVETFRTPAEGEPVHVDLITTGQQRAVAVLWTDDAAGAYARLVSEGCRSLNPPQPWLTGRRPLAG